MLESAVTHASSQVIQIAHLIALNGSSNFLMTRC